MGQRRSAAWRHAVLFFMTPLFWAAIAFAETIHVPDDHPTIQAAIDAAKDGDEILVAPGTYFESINMLGKAVTLRSSDGPEVTIIDGHESTAAVTCNSGEGPDTVIDGFTLRHTSGKENSVGMRNINSGPTILNCRFGSEVGIGIYNQGSSATISNCVFVDIGCWDCDGAGGIRNVDADVTISDCSFDNNWSDGGSAIFSVDSNVEVIGGSFTDNFGHIGAGAIQHAGGNLNITGATFNGNYGGMGDAGAVEPWFGGSSPTVITIVESTFIANDGGYGAGAVRGAETIIRSTFIGNLSDYGGTVRMDDGIIEDCVFEDNLTIFGAGAIQTSGSPIIRGSTFAHNSVPTDSDGVGAIKVVGKGNPQIEHSTFCGNDPGHILGTWTDLGGNSFGPHCPVGDLNGDGVVDVFDLLILLSAWGACANPAECLADLNGDGVVDVFDLLILLGNWG